MLFLVDVRMASFCFKQEKWFHLVQVCKDMGYVVTCRVNVPESGLPAEEMPREAASLAREALEWNIDKNASTIVHDEHGKFVASFMLRTVETLEKVH